MADLKLEMSKARSIELKQVFAAPIEKVWDAWTNPESLKQWKSPDGMTTPEAESDHKKGGKWRVVMEGNGHSLGLGGEYLEIDEPHKLVYTWLWEGAPAETHTTTVTVLLNKLAEDQTEVTLIHSGFPDENMKQEHTSGWDQTLKKLNQFLTK